MSGKFYPGQPGGPGRPKGKLNYKTEDLRARVIQWMEDKTGQANFCPVLGILEKLHDPEMKAVLADYIQGYDKVAGYIYPKLKAVDVEVSGNVDVKIDMANELFDKLKEEMG